MNANKTTTRSKSKASRCPYCHDDVQREQAAVCQDCQAPHHEDCWQEGGGHCSACSSSSMTPPQASPARILTREEVTRVLKEAGYLGAEINLFFAREELNAGHLNLPEPDTQAPETAPFWRTALTLAVAVALIFIGLATFIQALAEGVLQIALPALLCNLIGAGIFTFGMHNPGEANEYSNTSSH